MGLDDVDGCEHQWETDTHGVTNRGNAGFAFEHRCALCGAISYEPAAIDRYPDTNGVDPAFYDRLLGPGWRDRGGDV